MQGDTRSAFNAAAPRALALVNDRHRWHVVRHLQTAIPSASAGADFIGTKNLQLILLIQEHMESALRQAAGIKRGSEHKRAQRQKIDNE